MTRHRLLMSSLIFLLAITIGNDSFGQPIQVTTPFTSASDSFFENHGVSFGFSIPGGRGPGSRVVGFSQAGIQPNLTFNQGGANSAVPQFGGFDPNAGANFGFRQIGRNGGGFSLGLSLGKGSNRSLVSSAPTLVVQNGYGGSMFDGTVRPFVTSVTPVIGAGYVDRGGVMIPPTDNSVTRALSSGQLDLTRPVEPPPVPQAPDNYSDPASSAQSGDISVAAIKAQRAKEAAIRIKRIEALVSQAEKYESEGDFREARRSLRKAILECKDDSFKRSLRSRLKQLSGK